MADKKITDLTELTALDQSDLFVVVDDPAGTPITKKITATSLFGNVAYVTSSTTKFGTTLRARLTHNAVMTTANVVSAAEFVVNATGVSTNTSHQYGITVSNMLGESAANVTTELATAKFTLDVSNAAALVVNTFGLIVSVANTGARAAQPSAFIKFTDSLTSTNATSTKYLFSANVGSGAGALVNTSATATTVNARIRCQINGTDYWIPVSTSGA
jgi:hypothetical protein